MVVLLCIWCSWCQMSREIKAAKSYQTSANKSHDATSSNGSQPTSCHYAGSRQQSVAHWWKLVPAVQMPLIRQWLCKSSPAGLPHVHTLCTEYMYVYSAHCLLYKSVSMYCLYVNCFCSTVWRTLSRISLTKAHVLCDVTVKVI